MKGTIAILLSLWLSVGIISCLDEPEDALMIGAASNLQFAMLKLADEFEESTGIQTQLLINSSGNLTAQIEQGLQLDVFVSADMQYPMSLYRSGYGVDRPALYAYGELVIIGHDITEPDFDGMLDPEVDNVAIANPKTAPYGRKAMLALENAGLWDTLQPKIVVGENVSHAHQFVSSGAAAMGVVAKSLVIESGSSGIAGWTPIPDSLYNPIAQGMLIIKHDGYNEDHTNAFIEFMISDEAKSILEHYGYRTALGE